MVANRRDLVNRYEKPCRVTLSWAEFWSFPILTSLFSLDSIWIAYVNIIVNIFIPVLLIISIHILKARFYMWMIKKNAFKNFIAMRLKFNENIYLDFQKRISAFYHL